MKCSGGFGGGEGGRRREGGCRFLVAVRVTNSPGQLSSSRVVREREVAWRYGDGRRKVGRGGGRGGGGRGGGGGARRRRTSGTCAWAGSRHQTRYQDSNVIHTAQLISGPLTDREG